MGSYDIQQNKRCHSMWKINDQKSNGKQLHCPGQKEKTKARCIDKIGSKDQYKIDYCDVKGEIRQT